MFYLLFKHSTNQPNYYPYRSPLPCCSFAFNIICTHLCPKMIMIHVNTISVSYIPPPIITALLSTLLFSLFHHPHLFRSHVFSHPNPKLSSCTMVLSWHIYFRSFFFFPITSTFSLIYIYR